MKGLRIRPEKNGMQSTLFDLEADIMEIVWDNQLTHFSVSDIHRALEEDREIAYTTVMTTIDRLYKKELLSRQKDGRKYIYSSKMTRSEFIKAMTKSVLNSLPPMGQETAMALLVDQVAEGDQSKLDQLEALIQKKRNKRLESSDEA